MPPCSSSTTPFFRRANQVPAPLKLSKCLVRMKLAAHSNHSTNCSTTYEKETNSKFVHPQNLNLLQWSWNKGFISTTRKIDKLNGSNIWRIVYLLQVDFVQLYYPGSTRPRLKKVDLVLKSSAKQWLFRKAY